jgi:hypothetical protein
MSEPPRGDWTTDAADRIEGVVGLVRDRTVVPAQKATRAIVFGLLTTFFIGTALTMLSIGAFRALAVYLPGGVWAAHLVMGGIFVTAGTFFWARRTSSPRADTR